MHRENSKVVPGRPGFFFDELRSYWTPVPPGINDSFLAETKSFIDLENRLREDPDLVAYDRELYPEIMTLLDCLLPAQKPMTSGEPIVTASSLRGSLHLCNYQLQIMENVFLALKLPEYHAHPLNRGWMNLFRRWTTAPTLRMLWPSLKAIYSKRFVAFAEYQLNLSGMEPQIQRFPLSTSPSAADLKYTKLSKAERISSPPPFTELLKWRQADEHARVPHTCWERTFRELGQEWPSDVIETADKEKGKKSLSGEDRYRRYFEPFEHATDVWTISHPASGEEMWGIAMLAPHSEQSTLLRLLLWIRPGFRHVGLGSRLAETVMNNLDAYTAEVDPKNIFHHTVVVLPPLSQDKPGYGTEKAGWLQFYDRYDFVRMTTDQAQQLLQWPPEEPFDPEAFCLAPTALWRKPLSQDNAAAPQRYPG